MNFSRRKVAVLLLAVAIAVYLMRTQKREFARGTGDKRKVLKYIKDNASNLEGFGIIAVLEEEGIELDPDEMEKIIEFAEDKDGKKKRLSDFILAL
jgi:hypothetical protein